MEAKYYLSFNGGSGIKAKTKEEALNYLKEELERLEQEQPDELVDIELNSYKEDNQDNQDNEDNEEIEMNVVRKYRRKKDGHEFIRYECDKEELYGDTNTRLYSTQDRSGDSDIDIDIKDLDTDYELLEEWEEEA